MRARCRCRPVAGRSRARGPAGPCRPWASRPSRLPSTGRAAEPFRSPSVIAPLWGDRVTRCATVRSVDFTVAASERDGRTIVTAAGELDVHTAPALQAELNPRSQQPGAALVVDLTDVGFIDSTGLGVLVDDAEARARGRRNPGRGGHLEAGAEGLRPHRSRRRHPAALDPRRGPGLLLTPARRAGDGSVTKVTFHVSPSIPGLPQPPSGPCVDSAGLRRPLGAEPPSSPARSGDRPRSGP